MTCGDVYSVPPHVGRGGWTWYSGSAAWMYRVAIENILGLRLAGDTLTDRARHPRAGRKFEATIRHGDATYKITVENPAAAAAALRRHRWMVALSPSTRAYSCAATVRPTKSGLCWANQR